MDKNEIIELLEKDILSCKRNANDRIDNIADIDYAITTLNTLKEAINYTRCCKSDSEQLCDCKEQTTTLRVGFNGKSFCERCGRNKA